MRKKGIIIFLLSIMAINSLSLNELFKIPVLISHFFEHQQRGTDISFIEYLSMHYWGEDINDNDQDRDMQLPFKKVDFSQGSLTLFVQHSAEFHAVSFPAERTYAIHASTHLISNHLGSLFKPPRFA